MRPGRRNWRWLVLVAALAVPLSAGAAYGQSRLQHQAWAQSSPVLSFTPKSGDLYVAVSAGVEEARAFVRLDLGNATAGSIAGWQLALREVAGDSLMPADAHLVVCPVKQPLASDGKLSAAPATDCAVHASAVRGASGTWTVNLEPFAASWATRGSNGLALYPDAGTTTEPATARLAVSVAGTRVITPAKPSSAPTGAAAPVASAAGPTDRSEPASAGALVGVPQTPPNQTVPAVGASSAPVVAEPPAPAAASERSAFAGAHLPPGAPTGAEVLIGLLLVLASGAAVLASGRVRGRAPVLMVPASPIAAVRGSMLALVGALALSPLLGGDSTAYKAGLVLIFFVAAVGLHVLVNWAGQLSLAHASMVGIPAFAVLSLSQKTGLSPIYLLPVGLLIGAAVGLVIAVPTLRASPLQVAIVTLLAGIAIDRFFYSRAWLVGGAGGRQAAPVRLGPLDLTTSRSMYPVLLVVVAAVVVTTWLLMHSKVARSWAWVRSDPAAASALGIRVATTRLSAYGVAGAFAGLAGGLTSMWIGSFDASAFPEDLSFAYLLIAVLAGRGFLGGVAFATLVLQGGLQFGPDIVGLDSKSVFNAILAYGGPMGLIYMIGHYQAGLNGWGRGLMQRLTSKEHTMEHPGQPRRTLTVAPTLVLAAVLIAAGFFAIIIGWRHSGQTNQLWIQNQYLVSGGLMGLGLIIVGVGLFLRDALLSAVSNHTVTEQAVAPLLPAPASSNGSLHADHELVVPALDTLASGRPRRASAKSAAGKP